MSDEEDQDLFGRGEPYYTENESIEVNGCVVDEDDEFETTQPTNKHEMTERLVGMRKENDQLIEQVEQASVINTDLIMNSIYHLSVRLKKAESALEKIATYEQMDEIRKREDTQGIAIAYSVLKGFFEDARLPVRNAQSDLRDVRKTMDVVQDFIKYWEYIPKPDDIRKGDK